MPLFCLTAILVPERTAEMVRPYANPLSCSIRDTFKSIPGSVGPSLSRNPYSTERAPSPRSNRREQIITRHRFLYREETQTLVLYGHVPIDTAADSLIVFGIAWNR